MPNSQPQALSVSGQLILNFLAVIHDSIVPPLGGDFDLLQKAWPWWLLDHIAAEGRYLGGIQDRSWHTHSVWNIIVHKAEPVCKVFEQLQGQLSLIDQYSMMRWDSARFGNGLAEQEELGGGTRTNYVGHPQQYRAQGF